MKQLIKIITLFFITGIITSPLFSLEDNNKDLGLWDLKNWQGTWFEEGISYSSPMGNQGSFIGSTELTHTSNGVYSMMEARGIWKENENDLSYPYNEYRIYTIENNEMKCWIFPSSGRVLELSGPLYTDSNTIVLTDEQKIFKQTITMKKKGELNFTIEFRASGIDKWMKAFEGNSYLWQKKQTSPLNNNEKIEKQLSTPYFNK